MFDFYFCRQSIFLKSFNTPEVSRGLNNLAGDRYPASRKLTNKAMKCFFFFFTDEMFLEKRLQKASCNEIGKHLSLVFVIHSN